MSEVEEDALFFGEEAEDLAGDIKAELSSWPKRFPVIWHLLLNKLSNVKRVCKHYANKSVRYL